MLDQQTLHRRARRVLPACLRTEAVIAASGEGGLWAGAGGTALAGLLLPLRHVHRGGLWFRLASETRAALRTGPMRFLQDATEAREGLSRHGVPMTWGPWHATPGDAPAHRYTSGSRDGRARLWVLPETGVVVYAWDDRRGLAAEESGRCP